jgi:hypothetical protein
MTYAEIVARLDEFDPECTVRANQKGGGFWTAVKELRAFLIAERLTPKASGRCNSFPTN